MARTFAAGFEIRNTGLSGLESPTGTGATADTSIFRSGSTSGKVQLTSGVAGRWTMGGFFPTTGYYRFYVMVTARPATTARRLWGTTGAGIVNMLLNPAGTIAFRVDTTVIGTSTTALTDTARWYRVEFRTPNGSSVPVLLIDGATEVTGSPSGWSTTGDLGSADTVADTYTAYFDDVAVDDTEFPGQGRVVLLLPTSDNARASLWTGGSGGTTNLFDAVNNTPPVGTATESNTTQIEHAGGAAGSTDAYDANMTTYLAAGLDQGAQVRMVAMVAWDGEDVTTGTKLLAYSIVSNPAVASPGNVTAGDDVGLLGTYPSNWSARYRGVTANPSVDVSAAPVMRVVRPETASRVASVCFMGIYVEFTPGPSLNRPRVNHYPQVLAH